MQFFVRTVGNLVGIFLTALTFPAIAFNSGAGFFTSLGLLLLLALALSAANSLPSPLVQIFPYGLYIAIFGLLAIVSNTLIVSLTLGLSESVNFPFVVSTLGAAVFCGVVTALISTGIEMYFYWSYRE